MKTMILAAGRGERMRPLTDTIPKPLAPFRGGCLIDPLLHALHRAGIQEVVINVCHLAEQIVNYLGNGERYGLRIQYSYEVLTGGLETGGGVYQALPLLGTEPFLVISADIVTDFSWAPFIHQPLRGLAHLVFVDNPVYHPQGDFHLEANGQVALQGNRMLTYANIGILHPQLFASSAPGKFPLRLLFQEAISKQRLTGEYYQGDWRNIGTMEELRSI